MCWTIIFKVINHRSQHNECVCRSTQVFFQPKKMKKPEKTIFQNLKFEKQKLFLFFKF